MNLHMTRRLEVLAREIAASKATKIDAAANALFAEAARKHDKKAPSDWGKSKGAVQVTKTHAYRCETCCDTFRVMTMVCYGGRPFEKEDDCPDCSTLEAQFIPNPDAVGDGWVAFDSRTDTLPKGWGEDYFDLRVMSRGKPFEHFAQVYGQRGHQNFYVTAYRRVVKP